MFFMDGKGTISVWPCFVTLGILLPLLREAFYYGWKCLLRLALKRTKQLELIGFIRFAVHWYLYSFVQSMIKQDSHPFVKEHLPQSKGMSNWSFLWSSRPLEIALLTAIRPLSEFFPSRIHPGFEKKTLFSIKNCQIFLEKLFI